MTEHAPHPASFGDLLFPAINFALFVWLLVWFLRAPIREYFRTRTEQVREALAAGARARQEAEALRSVLARDVAELPTLRERLRADLRATAERECATIIAAGSEAARRIRADARALADHEFTSAREALRAELVEDAVRQAMVILRAAVRAEDQERFVRDFVQSAGAAE